MDQEIHALLHALWTKAVGTSNYDKRQWIRLEELLRKQADPEIDTTTPTSPTLPPRSS